MKLELLRLSTKNHHVTKGVLIINGNPCFSTLELPWRDNKPLESCIPAGTYSIKKAINRRTLSGSKIPLTIEVCDVPERSGILFHVGNIVGDSKGCVLVGEGFGMLNGHEGIINSNRGFRHFSIRIQDAVFEEDQKLCISYWQE